jgi:hypothetical protein
VPSQHQDGQQVLHDEPADGNVTGRDMEVPAVSPTRISTTVLAIESATSKTNRALHDHPNQWDRLAPSAAATPF